MQSRFHTMRATGTYVTTTTLGEAVRAFVPHPLPPAEPPLAPASYTAAAHRAEMALARLSGVAGLVPSVDWLLYSAIRKEALFTSQIEGTQATLTDLFDDEAGLTVANTDDVEEVTNYLRAFRLVRDNLRGPTGLPISVRLLCDAHRLLLDGARGASKQPGELRRSQNWIGGARPGRAVFVPPPPDQVPGLLADLERFIHDAEPALPPLVRIALVHVQFETIHPFLDGNGRIGRLLVGLMLVQERRLTTPLLYMSGYLEAHRNTYYSLLQGVRERGEIQEWIQFFLTAIARSADDAVHRAGLVVRLREEYLQDAARSRSMIAGLVDLVFTNPYLTVRRVQNHLGITNQGARNLIKDAQARGYHVASCINDDVTTRYRDLGHEGVTKKNTRNERKYEAIGYHGRRFYQGAIAAPMKR